VSNSEIWNELSRFGNIVVTLDNVGNTVIRIDNIFIKYPLRRKLMNPHIEAQRIKEYICETSLLHHRVVWNVNIIVNDQPDILTLLTCESVANSFARNFHEFSHVIFKTEVSTVLTLFMLSLSHSNASTHLCLYAVSLYVCWNHCRV
jgi:DNA mismatch repair ATPase MutL